MKQHSGRYIFPRRYFPRNPIGEIVEKRNSSQNDDKSGGVIFKYNIWYSLLHLYNYARTYT